MAGNDLSFTVHVLPWVSVPGAEVLVSIFGRHSAGHRGHSILLRYEIISNA
jgi:hypothetical protein